MRVVIIEDEEAALELLRGLLMDSEGVDIEVVETIESVEESIEFFSSSRCRDIDLVFMDIHLSDGYAFSIFNYVEVAIPIIFTTAYDEYALKSFEVNCVDYILKPITKHEVDRIFSKIRVISEYGSALIEKKRGLDTILVVDRWHTIPLNITDVAYLYKDGSKVKVCNREGRSFVANQTLEWFEEQLSRADFIRANRQFIIARSSIISIESYEGSRALVNLSVVSPESVIISRTKVSAFKIWLGGN